MAKQTKAPAAAAKPAKAATGAPCLPPRARVVHADPAAPATAEQQPMPKEWEKRGPDQKSPAEWMYGLIWKMVGLG